MFPEEFNIFPCSKSSDLLKKSSSSFTHYHSKNFR